MRSGFVAVVGRPNVGKSTLVNAMVGTKVSITSSRPNTTRHRILGVLHRPGAQVVFVDTPGIHRPRSALGTRLNETADHALSDVDVILVLLDATAPVGPGDRRVLERSLREVGRPAGDGGSTRMVVVVNKVDTAREHQVLERLQSARDTVEALAAPDGRTAPDATAARAESVEYFPVSARTAKGVDELTAHIVATLDEGPPFFPDDVVTDTPEALWVAELVREQLLLRTRDELPHSISCRVTEWDWPLIRCEVLVERESQKAIVIGRAGSVLKSAGIAVRRELPEGAYLDLHVKVESRWQDREEVLDRLGY
ncbi:MAG TPA: GTPase Era [Acidimicrobiales bacterium]|nr:GTPase Era [Acidimicrobiales bacterium]